MFKYNYYKGGMGRSYRTSRHGFFAEMYSKELGEYFEVSTTKQEVEQFLTRDYSREIVIVAAVLSIALLTLNHYYPFWSIT